jgi:transposase InsO family protein
MVREHRLSIARACRAAKLSRAAYYRQGIDWARRDAPVVDALNGVVAYVERYNRSFRNEVLDAYVFESLDQVRELSAEWLQMYNEERPHDALGSMPPARFRALIESKTTSTSELST